MLNCFSRVWFFATPWTPEGSIRLLCPWNSPGKNTGVGCHALLQGIFPTQGSNPYLLCLLHWQVGSLPLALCVCVCVCVSHSIVSNSSIPWTVACPDPLSIEFSRQEYWSGLSLLSPGDLAKPGIKPSSLSLQKDSLPSELSEKPINHHILDLFSGAVFI